MMVELILLYLIVKEPIPKWVIYLFYFHIFLKCGDMIINSGFVKGLFGI